MNVAFNMDCMEAMAEMADKSFDLAIVDPPYGIGYSTRVAKTSRSTIRYTPKQWDEQTPTQDYFDELFRVSVSQMIFGGNYFALPPTRCFVVWDKCQPEGVDQAMCEKIWTSFDRSAKIVRESIQQIQFSRIHPTEKPLRLYKWLLTNYAKQGDKILDTHLGSGSSRIAAYDLGFDFTGYELDTDYFNAQEERFERHIAQGKLFSPVVEAPAQEQLFGK